MRRRQGKVNCWVITVLAVIALVFFFVESNSKHLVRSRLYEEKFNAARTSAKAFEIVRNYRQNKVDLPIDSVNDPNGTGLIGLHFSNITYGRSDLSDGLTTTNPNFGAALIEMLYRIGIRSNDTIAVNWDGTYPALNIEVLAVAKTLALFPVIVTAQSGGMWGANYQGLTWLEIEQVLRDSGLWNFKSALATLGGEADDGRGISPEGRDLLLNIAESLGVPIFIPESISDGVAKRMKLFSECKALVAVGLPVTNSGDHLLRLPSRIFTDRHTRAGNGVVAQFLNNRRPVIHIAKPSRVALDYRLPVAPVPIPVIGKGRLYYERRYSVPLALIFSLIIIILLFITVRYEVEYYFKAKSQEEGNAV